MSVERITLIATLDQVAELERQLEKAYATKASFARENESLKQTLDRINSMTNRSQEASCQAEMPAKETTVHGMVSPSCPVCGR